MSNIIHFPTPAQRTLDRGNASLQEARALVGYNPAAAIERLLQLTQPGQAAEVREEAARCLYERFNVRVLESDGRPVFEPQCLYEPNHG